MLFGARRTSATPFMRVGGMGDGYRAGDTRLDRGLAIKVLTEELASDLAGNPKTQSPAREREATGELTPRRGRTTGQGSEPTLRYFRRYCENRARSDWTTMIERLLWLVTYPTESTISSSVITDTAPSPVFAT